MHDPADIADLVGPQDHWHGRGLARPEQRLHRAHRARELLDLRPPEPAEHGGELFPRRAVERFEGGPALIRQGKDGLPAVGL